MTFSPFATTPLLQDDDVRCLPVAGTHCVYLPTDGQAECMVYCVAADRSQYWTYSGSLTTPPCYESVRFLAFKNPVQVSEQQVYTVHRDSKTWHLTRVCIYTNFLLTGSADNLQQQHHLSSLHTQKVFILFVENRSIFGKLMDCIKTSKMCRPSADVLCGRLPRVVHK